MRARLLPGDRALPLEAVVRVLPADAVLSVEAPLGGPEEVIDVVAIARGAAEPLMARYPVTDNNYRKCLFKPLWRG